MSYPNPIIGNNTILGVPDDTQEAQAAFDAEGIIVLGPKNYNIRSLNFTNQFGGGIMGVGPRSLITPIQANVSVLDFTGASHSFARDLRIGATQDPNGPSPHAGILNAQNNTSYSSDAMNIRGVRIDGRYQLAAHYDYGVASSSIQHSQLYNYTGGFVSVHTGINGFGAYSQFTAIGTQTYLPSDWTFEQVEHHDLNGAGPGFGTAIWLGGVGNFRYIGGNVSSSRMPVSINAIPAVGGGAHFPINVSFHGTTFYADYAPAPAYDLENNAGATGAPVFSGYSAGHLPRVRP